VNIKKLMRRAKEDPLLHEDLLADQQSSPHDEIDISEKSTSLAEWSVKKLKLLKKRSVPVHEHLVDQQSKEAQAVTIFVNSQYGYGSDNNDNSWEDAASMRIPDCPVPCELRKDAAAFNDSDIAVFNPRWMHPFAHPPRFKPPHQKWVFNYDFEAPVHPDGTKELYEERVTDYLAEKIDWTFTYKTTSDFFKPLFQLVPPAETGELPKWSERSSLMMGMMSNCATGRQHILHKLMDHMPEGSSKVYGNCGEKMPCGTFGGYVSGSDPCMQNITKQFKFYAAFENTRCGGYITEKLQRAYMYGLVPVVLGGVNRSDYERVAPGNSFIHVSDFASLKDLADYLAYLGKKPDRI
jgi:hypothetical protein